MSGFGLLSGFVGLNIFLSHLIVNLAGLTPHLVCHTQSRTVDVQLSCAHNPRHRESRRFGRLVLDQAAVSRAINEKCNLAG